MAITAAVCNSYKKELLDGSGTHLAADVFKIALYTSFSYSRHDKES